MKKTLALLMLATMLFSVGCGNQAKDAAKDAQQKVEQKADEVKKDAEQKVDEVKKDAEQKVDEAKDKAAEVKEDAAKKVEETKEASIEAADEAAKKAAETKADIAAKAEEVTVAANEKVIALGGLMPGVSVEDVQAMFGEPTNTEGNVLTFADGLKVVLDGAKKVKSISTMVDAFETTEGMYVGASEYSLNDNCGPADAVRKIDRGAEYEYNSGDKKSVVIYKAQDGVITEIICSLK